MGERGSDDSIYCLLISGGRQQHALATLAVNGGEVTMAAVAEKLRGGQWWHSKRQRWVPPKAGNTL